MKLTQRQEKFCREVVKGKSYSDAYRAAYGTKSLRGATVWVEAYKTHTRPHVANRIKQLQEQAAERLLMSRQQYLERIEKMILADIRTVLDPQGNVIDINQFPDDVTELIEGIEVVENFQKVGDKAEHVGYTKKIKFAGKRGLLKDYGQARGWLEPEESKRPKRVIIREFVLVDEKPVIDVTPHD